MQFGSNMTVPWRATDGTALEGRVGRCGAVSCEPRRNGKADRIECEAGEGLTGETRTTPKKGGNDPVDR